MVSDHRKLYRLLKLITLLSSGKSYPIAVLSEGLETSKRSVYRYFHLLEEVGFIIDKNFQGNYFMHTPGPLDTRPFFTLEEVETLRKLAAVGDKGNPLIASILRKVFETSETSVSAETLVRARLSRLIDLVQEAIATKKQVFLISYHSGNSNQISDRLVEPVSLSDDYSFLLAYEPSSDETKLFKLDRMADVIIATTHWHYADKHHEVTRDAFNMLGSSTTNASMRLTVKAFNLLREEYPATIPYIEKRDVGHYLFHGPVSGFEGIGRFILGLPGEVSEVQPKELVEYLKRKRNTQDY